MKKAFLHIILLCLACGAWAQPKLEKEEYYLGVHAGALASMVQFTPTVAQNIKNPFLGANGGLVFRYAGHEVCGLQVEVNYMQRGWKEEQTDYVRQLDYIEVPLLMHLYFGKRGRGFINLGPQVGYCFRSQAWNSPVESVHQYAPIDKPIDWGLAGGLGFYYRTKKAGAYQLEARFNYSFGGIYAQTKRDWFSSSNPMNLSLNLAYLWEFKNR